MSERALGCHCDLEPGQQPTGCVFDGHEPVENCSVAMRLRAEGKSQAQCEHWRPVQPSEVEQLRAEVASLRLTDVERETLVVRMAAEIARLRAEVERLRMTSDEQAAAWYFAVIDGPQYLPGANAAAAALRALLARHGGDA